MSQELVEEFPADPRATGFARFRSKQKAPLVFSALTAIAVFGGGAYAIFGYGRESTDNAQIEGHIITVAARTVGQVSKVLVKDNQHIKAGDVLVELDPAELEARLQSARADREAANAQLLSAQTQLTLTEINAGANLRQAEGSLVQAESVVNTSVAIVAQAKADRERSGD